MLFLPVIFFCTIQGVCAFKALPAVTQLSYCNQAVIEVKSRLEPFLDDFSTIAVGCVAVQKANEV
jgi:hypothetical protein